MKASLSFITRTATVCESVSDRDAATAGTRTLQVLGHDPLVQKVYLLEHGQDGVSLPNVHSIRAAGWLADRSAPVRELDGRDANNAADWNARLEVLKSRLTPLFAVGEEHFRLSTRVVDRRAVQLSPETLPVRQYDLRVTVRPRSRGKIAPMGARKTITAFSRPRVRLADVWVHPGLQFAIAMVSYTGVPFEIGYERQTAIYLPLSSGLKQPR